MNVKTLKLLLDNIEETKLVSILLTYEKDNKFINEKEIVILELENSVIITKKDDISIYGYKLFKRYGNEKSLKMVIESIEKK